MRGLLFFAIFIASSLGHASLATNCNTHLLGPTRESSAQQFMNISRAYLATLGPQADRVVSMVVKSKTPINPVQSAVSSKDLQFQVAFARQLQGLPNSSWAVIQNEFADWKKSHVAIKHDEADKKSVTSTIAQIGYIGRYDIQGGDKVSAHIVAGDVAYTVIVQHETSVLIATDLTNGESHFIRIVCDSKISCFPAFFTGANEQVYFVNSRFNETVIYKLKGNELEPVKSIGSKENHMLQTSVFKLHDGKIVIARATAEATEYFHFEESTRDASLIGEVPHVKAIRWKPEVFSFAGRDFFLNETDDSQIVIYEFLRDPLQVRYFGRLAVSRPNRKKFRFDNHIHTFVQNGSLHIAFSTSQASEDEFQPDYNSLLHVFNLGTDLRAKRSLLTWQTQVIASEKYIPIKSRMFNSMALVQRGQRAIIANTSVQGLQISEYTENGNLQKVELLESQSPEVQVTQALDNLGRDFIMTISDNRLNYYEVTADGGIVVVDRYKLNNYNDRYPPLYMRGTKQSFIGLIHGGIEVLSTMKQLP